MPDLLPTEEDPRSTKGRANKRVSALKQERSSFINHWTLLSQFVRPRQGRFEVTDVNKGDRRHHKDIINSKATRALRTATAGMFNGTMSPTRAWFALEAEQRELNQLQSVRQWFHEVRERMLRIMSASNLYRVAPKMISETLLFGTGCVSHENDLFNLAHFEAQTIGSYMIAQNDRQEVTSVAREMMMTTEQIVEKFSPDRSRVSKNISERVRTAYDRGDYDLWWPVTHLVEPNRNFKPDDLRPKNRRFRSVYWEPGDSNHDRFLSESGFSEFPFYAPRWETTNEDVYGTDCPGMQALGDIRQLQLEEKKKAQGIEKMVSPPLHGPAALRSQQIGNMPGQATLYDTQQGAQGLRPVYEVRLDLNALREDIAQVEHRIDEAFFVDLFRAISSMEGIQPKNMMELVQRQQEKLLELGPVLERMYSDFLNKLISRLFIQMAQANLLPPPPPELQGQLIRPKFISTLALAQQSAVTGSIERLLGFVAQVASVNPSALDKFDADQAIDEFAMLIGSPPSLVIDDGVVQQVREARAEQEQQLQEAALAQQGAQTVKTLADAGGQ